jgi:predicted MFS family arabinose efflux permease
VQDTDSQQRGVTPGVMLLMATACGVMVANLYYAQPIIGLIGPQVGLSPWAAGAIVTLTQLGYGLGLALIVPLSDLVENKRLVLIANAGAVLGAVGVGLARTPTLFLLASLTMGICSVGVHVLVPLAAHLGDQQRQGRTIGTVMSGLLTGIMLSRPLASFIADAAGWRAVFFTSAALMSLVGIALALKLPARKPHGRMTYGAMLASMARMLRGHRQLQLRSAYHGLMFLAFNMFWTAAPLALTHQFHLRQRGVAIFALAGSGGALAAPIAGWLADHGKARLTTVIGMALLALSFLAADVTVAAASLIGFAIAAVVIDAGVQLNQISGQRILFSLVAEMRGRINATYMTIIFLLGAAGSLIGSATYERGGWTACGLVGAGVGALALTLFALFDRTPATTAVGSVGQAGAAATGAPER